MRFLLVSQALATSAIHKGQVRRRWGHGATSDFNGVCVLSTFSAAKCKSIQNRYCLTADIAADFAVMTKKNKRGVPKQRLWCGVTSYLHTEVDCGTYLLHQKQPCDRLATLVAQIYYRGISR